MSTETAGLGKMAGTTEKISPGTVAALITALLIGGLVAGYAPLIALAALAGVSVLWLFSARPDYFILAFALYTPFEELILKWLPEAAYTPARYAWEGVLLAVFAVVVFRSLVRTGRPSRSTPIDPPCALLILVIFLSAVVNEVPAPVAVLGMKNLLRYVLVFYVIVNTEMSDSFVRRLVYLLLALAFFEGVLGVSQYALKGPYLEFFRPADVVFAGVTVREAGQLYSNAFGTMGRYNLYGNFLNLMACLAMGIYYAGGERDKAKYGLFFTVVLAGVFVSYSRMSWLGIYVAFVLILLFQKKKRVIIYLALPVLATVALVSAYKGIYWHTGETGKASAVERYVAMFSEGYIEKAKRYDRLFALFVTAPAVVEKYPVFGLGPGTFANEVTGGGIAARGLYPEHSHADRLGIRKQEALQYTVDQGWVSILGQIGLAGLFAFAWLYYRLFAFSYRAYAGFQEPFPRGIALGFLGILGLLIFQNFMSFNLTYRPVSLYLWLIAGLIYRECCNRMRN